MPFLFCLHCGSDKVESRADADGAEGDEMSSTNVDDAGSSDGSERTTMDDERMEAASSDDGDVIEAATSDAGDTSDVEADSDQQADDGRAGEVPSGTDAEDEPPEPDSPDAGASPADDPAAPSPQPPPELDLSGLIPMEGPFAIVTEAADYTLQVLELETGELTMLDPNWTFFGETTTPGRRGYVHFIDTGPSGTRSPRVTYAVQGGYLPPVDVIGDVFYNAGLTNLHWHPGGRFAAAWGGTLDSGEFITVLDMIGGAEVGAYPVTGTGSQLDFVGDSFVYRSDRESMSPAIAHIGSGDVVAPPRLVPDFGLAALGSDGSIWAGERDGRVLLYASSFDADFVELAVSEPIRDVEVAHDGESAFVIVESGALLRFTPDGNATDIALPTPVLSFRARITTPPTLFLSEQSDGDLLPSAVVDEQSEQVTQLEHLPAGGPRVIHGTHLIFSSSTGEFALVGVEDGEAKLVEPFPEGVGLVACDLDDDLYEPAGWLSVIALFDDGTRTLAIFDLTSAEAELAYSRSLSAAYSCPKTSIDGESFIMLAGDDDDDYTLQVANWSSPGELTPVLSPALPFMPQVYSTPMED